MLVHPAVHEEARNPLARRLARIRNERVDCGSGMYTMGNSDCGCHRGGDAGGRDIVLGRDPLVIVWVTA